MNRFANTLAAIVTTMVTLVSATGVAHAQMEKKMDMSQMTDGEIRKVDKETGKVTIKHGDIKNLEMPGMTMVFTAKEKSLLDKIQAGDKVKFAVINDGGKLVVTDIQAAK